MDDTESQWFLRRADALRAGNNPALAHREAAALFAKLCKPGADAPAHVVQTFRDLLDYFGPTVGMRRW